MSVLKVNGLTAGYPGRSLFSDLSFTAESPAFVAVVGHNGSGKSTFFKCLTGRHPYSGEIFIDGRNVLSVRNTSAQGYISLLEQKNQLNFNISVKDLVVMGRFRFTSPFKNYSVKDEKEVDEVLETIGITHLKNEDCLSLSGGEQQLVWLAQVMAQDPEIILLDEPTQQLDVYNRKRVFDLMQYWAYEKRKLTLCITHDLGNLEGLRGYILNFSTTKPEKEELSGESVRQHLELLEKGRMLI